MNAKYAITDRPVGNLLTLTLTRLADGAKLEFIGHARIDVCQRLGRTIRAENKVCDGVFAAHAKWIKR